MFPGFLCQEYLKYTRANPAGEDEQLGEAAEPPTKGTCLALKPGDSSTSGSVLALEESLQFKVRTKSPSYLAV